MPILDSYLFFNGNCREAMSFYQQALGGQMKMMLTYADSPEPMPCHGGKDRIMHCSLQIGDRTLMASDTPPDQPGPALGGFSLSLAYPQVQEAQRIFAALSEGGKVTMPIGKTFWSEAFGMLTDRFGVPWMVSGGEST